LSSTIFILIVFLEKPSCELVWVAVKQLALTVLSHHPLALSHPILWAAAEPHIQDGGAINCQ
jgi:hypothetical protein